MEDKKRINNNDDGYKSIISSTKIKT